MNSKTTPKDFFLHLGATIALYTSAVALINLCFSVINYYNPDVLAGYFSSNSIAWPVSMLVVLVPVLYVIEWFIGRDLARMPEKKDLWIRRWRIYLTLFLGGATVVGDLVVLINWYLNGEITDRFVYKILVVLVVAGVIFAYYLLARAVDSVRAKNWRKILAWFGIVVVLAGVVGGFLIVGSPAKQRAIRFDSQRVSDLTNIQWQIISYWQQRGKLPAALSDLNDPISNFSVPKDPDTSSSYGYSTKWTSAMSSNPAFELCATFSLASQDLSGKGAYGTGGSVGGAIPVGNVSYPIGSISTNDSWTHDAGHICFERTIDPARYPINPKINQ
ncbi:MAG: DUF5671 domain-containing protein [Minisyncoccia bacterium]|jgi:hypothetical protein